MDIVIDIGGTKTRVAPGTEGGIAQCVIFPTPEAYDEALNQLAETAKTLAGEGPIGRAVIGKTRRMWKEHDSFVDDVAARLGAEVIFENDTTLVGLGEAVFGAGKGADICVYVTVSTGVNGIRIVRGKIDDSRQGFEIGGQYLTIGENPQTLEDLVSGRAISARFNVASPRDIGKDTPLWNELADSLAFGVHNTILHWSPDRVVIGGSMMNEIGIPVDRVRERVAALMKKFPTVPEIVHSSLTDFGGLWGGLARLQQDN